MKTIQTRADLFENNLKELRAIATTVINMVSGNKSDQALGALYNSIRELERKIQDESTDELPNTKNNGE